MALHLALCAVGFVLLYLGAEWLVKGSSSLARAAGISPIVIGLTVVAFGTSAPELVVSLISSIRGQSMIAVGNVFGSNICNIALILGLAAVLSPITSDRSVVRRDIPLMIVTSIVVIALCWNSVLGRLEGAILFLGVVAYAVFNYTIARRERRELGQAAVCAELDLVATVEARWKQVVMVVVGIGAVIGGAQLVVETASVIMKSLGVDEKFIGLTIVAFGTSLPELATSIVAALRKEMAISIGNLVGSNVFNLLGVLGVAALASPIPFPGGFVESGLAIDAAIMVAVSVLPLLMMVRDARVGRLEGAMLLSVYAGFLAYLFVRT